MKCAPDDELEGRNDAHEARGQVRARRPTRDECDAHASCRTRQHRLPAAELQICTSERLARGPRKHPWFIAGFLIVAALVAFVPQLRGLGH